MQEPLFLTLAEVLEIHKDQIARYGGDVGIRDLGLLQSAVAQPEMSFGGQWLHKDLCAMSAAYAFHIAQNQPFLDGNKRAGLASALVFLELNGITIKDPSGRLYEAMIGIAQRKTDKDGLAEVLRSLF
ncbi:MAG: type II toxin-antitoxin system death-on-curing family toxin [Candidatus Omnitrophica bacterium]|nr:type II toxin-antitoxin system death-on-curing family toxin [Candidatus Omnitrophota bacterium]